MFAAIAYYFKYIVRNEMMTSVAVTITTIVPIFSMLIAARLNAKYSKRNISIVGTLIQILGSLIIWIGGSNVAIVFLGVGLMGFGMGFRSTCIFHAGRCGRLWRMAERKESCRNTDGSQWIFQ